MSSDLLAGLTAERLVQIAAEQREIAKRCDEMNIAHHALELAAICEAVAGAERAMLSIDNDVEFYRVGPADETARIGFDIRDMGELVCQEVHPTLLSALGAVGAEEKHDG